MTIAQDPVAVCMGAIKCTEFYGTQTLKATGTKTAPNFSIIRMNLSTSHALKLLMCER